MLYFNTPDVATGYADSRPFSHPLVIRRVKSTLSIKDRLAIALDVGCGAGLSSIALAEIAEKVVGVDISRAMMRSGIKREGVQYCGGAAEYLPFNAEFDLITLSGALNWMQRSRCFGEARRILGEGCFVVVYDNGNQGSMKGNAEFSEWHGAFLEQYPKPPRDESPITPEEARGYGFEFVSSEEYTNEVAFSVDRFVDYLFTESNVTIALASNGNESCNRAGVRASLLPFFEDQEKRLTFGGYIWYMRKVSE
jgi:SAM-dependent methyltransferase